MKKRFKSIQIFLVIAISLFILALPAYLRCTNLSETKFASSDLGFENPGQENGLPDNGNELKVFGPTAFFTTFLLSTNLFEQSLHLFSHTLSLRQKTFVLRC
jgi:flagellar basal body-associated protein FliL